MKKRMEAISVTIEDDNEIVIQGHYDLEESAKVYLHVDQVDTLVKWLKEAKDKALKAPKSSA